MSILQDLFLLALGLWLVARQPPCLVRNQKLCAVEGLPYQLCAWVICCVDKSGEGNKLTAAHTGSAVVLVLFPIRVIPGIGFDHGVGHPLLLLGDAKAPNFRKNNAFNDLGHYSEWPKVADAVIKA